MKNPKVSLPPLQDSKGEAPKVEKDIVKDAKRRMGLEGRVGPTVAMVTWLDAARDGLCCAAVSNDAATVASGFSDGLVRLALLREAAQGGAPPKKKKAKAPDTASAAAAGAPGAPAIQPEVAEAMAAAGYKFASREGAGAAVAPAAAVVPAAEAAAPVKVPFGECAPAPAAAAATAAAEARRALAIETSQRMMATLRGHSGPVYSVAFSREDHYLVSGSQDGP